MNQEIERRRTFAIISHPDAGKTTLTEKLLLFGGQISRSFDLFGPALMRSLHGVPSLKKVVPVSDFSNATFNGLRAFINDKHI